jgi:hypothetical protein
MKDLELLSEYLDIYIQLLPNCTTCGGLKIKKEQLPTFDYFKKTYTEINYSLVVPNFKEAKTVYDTNKIGEVYAHGIGSEKGIAYRYYNYWMGCKYFTGGNLSGDYNIENNKINEILKINLHN